MARRHWTVVVVSDEDTAVRQYRFSREVIRAAIGGVLLLFAVATSLGAGLIAHRGADYRVRRLKKENALLRDEVGHIRQRATTLGKAVHQLREQDEEFRLVAGLEPLSDDVLQVGIGGPGTETLEGDPIYRMDAPTGKITFNTQEDIETLIRRARLLQASWSEATRSFREAQDEMASTPSIMPTRGFITSGFTNRRMHPILNIARAHEGIDIAAPKGSPIRAAANGVVSFVGRNGDYGLMIELDHGHGYTTRYAHASRAVVHVGQRVRRGDKIAEVGETGLAIGPHVHYEVLVNGAPQDPRNFLILGKAIPE